MTIRESGNKPLAFALAVANDARYIGEMELRVERLGMEGDGIGHGPDGDIYVPFCLPGEIVRGKVTGDRMPDAEILTASRHRVTPICRHFGTCGGCSLQHASGAFLADWKVEALSRALGAHGLSAPLRPIITAPANSRLRAVFAGRRTKKTVQVGFHGRASGAIIPISECHLIAPELLAARPALEALTRIGATRSSPVRLGVTLCDTGLDVAVTDAKPLAAALQAAAIAIAITHDFSRLSWNGEIIAAARPAARRFGRAIVVPPPGAFAQATSQGEAVLVAGVLEATNGAKRIADLFAGCGTFTLPLAELAEVHAVETDAAMLAALDAGWRQATGLKRVTHAARDLFARPLLAAELGRFDAVVLDPPRVGALAQCAQIAASAINRLAYVSCNPVSFARDAKVLAAKGFVLDWIQVVDQFRWSGHVELVARFRR